MKLKAVILLAGEGTRLQPFSTKECPKVLFHFLGKPLVCYHIEEFLRQGITDFVLVTNPENRRQVAKIVQKYFPKLQAHFAMQKEPRGPADALLAARPFLGRDDYFILKYADRIDPEEKVKMLLKRFREEPQDGAIFLSPVTEWQRYGIARFRNKELVEIVEKPTVNPPSPLAWRGLSILSAQRFLKGISLHRRRKGAKEVAPPEYVLRAGGKLNYIVKRYNKIDLGYPWDILALNRALLKKFGGQNRSRRIGKGVIISPQSYIGPQTVIGEGTHIGPNVSLERVKVGKRVTLEHTYVMPGCQIGDGAVIKYSVLGEDCVVGDHFQTRYRSRGKIRIPVKGEYVETQQKLLGCFLGHRVHVAPHLSAAPGKIVYSDRVVQKNIVQHLLPIKAILVDADNTLYTTREVAAWADQKAMEYLASQTKYSPAELYQYWSGKIIPKLKASSTPHLRHRRYSYQQLIATLKLPKSAQQAFLFFRKALGQKLQLFPGVREALAALKEYRKIVISEDNQDLINFKLRTLGLQGYFDEVVCAETVGTMKPSSKFFEYVLQKYHFLPEEIVMVGDDWAKDLAWARKLGMRTVIVGSDPRADRSIQSFTQSPSLLQGI